MFTPQQQIIGICITSVIMAISIIVATIFACREKLRYMANEQKDEQERLAKLPKANLDFCVNVTAILPNNISSDGDFRDFAEKVRNDISRMLADKYCAAKVDRASHLEDGGNV